MTTLDIRMPSHRTTPSAAFRWIRETPAPRWEGDAGTKARFAGYIAAAMAVSTALGLGGTALFGQLVEMLASLG